MDANQLLTKLVYMNQFDSNKYEQWSEWSLEDKKHLLQIYLLIVKHEPNLMDLVYGYHESDSYEDIFRDYDTFELREKSRGIQISIDVMNKKMIDEIDKENDI